MAKISADPGVLERVARELESIATDMDCNGGRLSRAGDEVAAVWKSQYTGQYLNSVGQTRNKISRSSNNLRAAASSLRSIAREVRRVEREIEQRERSRRGR